MRTGCGFGGTEEVAGDAIKVVEEGKIEEERVTFDTAGEVLMNEADVLSEPLGFFELFGFVAVVISVGRLTEEFAELGNITPVCVGGCSPTLWGKLVRVCDT